MKGTGAVRSKLMAMAKAKKSKKGGKHGSVKRGQKFGQGKVAVPGPNY